MDLYVVAIFHANDTVTPITHNVPKATAKSICRHYNRILDREITNPMDDTCCVMFSQTYCTNWRDFT